MPTRSATPVTNQDLAYMMAGLSEKVSGMDTRLTDVAKVAGEARDTSRTVATKLDVEGIPGKIADLRAEMHAEHGAIRTDFAHANSILKADMNDHAGRIGKLELAGEGPRTIWKWLQRHMPWIFAGITALIAALGMPHRH